MTRCLDPQNVSTELREGAPCQFACVQKRNRTAPSVHFLYPIPESTTRSEVDYLGGKHCLKRRHLHVGIAWYKKFFHKIRSFHYIRSRPFAGGYFFTRK